METFRAKLGTTFRFRSDLSGEILIQFANDSESGRSLTRVTYLGNVVSTVQIPVEDFLELAAHVAGLPPWAPEKDAYDRETTELILAHVARCKACDDAGRRCSSYWELILNRVKEKERRATQ